jgi:DNA-binding NtrC family response regulator
VIRPTGIVAIPLAPERDRWVLGRSKDADIPIDDASVSRRHAMLYGGPPFEIEDLRSENGTSIATHVGIPPSPDSTAPIQTRRLAPGERVPVEPDARLQCGQVTVVLQAGALEGRIWRAPMRSGATPLPPDVVATSPAMRRVYWLAEQFAQGTISILILGETGVGKEILAEYIHRASPRQAGPFVRVNCASLRGEQLESELFGHDTGAVASKPGRIEQANGGTLFLDEVGEMPADVQARLLRFLEDRRVSRVGATDVREVDVRVIAATNRDLAADVASGRFRNDLYFRLDGVALAIPPLRHRRKEIAPLARHFARAHAHTLGRPTPELDASALAALEELPLAGNARELRNLIERALLLCEPGAPLRAEHLMLDGQPVPGPSSTPGDDEARRIVQALEACAGNQTRAAELLGMTRRALIVRLERYGLQRPLAGRRKRNAT